MSDSASQDKRREEWASAIERNHALIHGLAWRHARSYTDQEDLSQVAALALGNLPFHDPDSAIHPKTQAWRHMRRAVVAVQKCRPRNHVDAARATDPYRLRAISVDHSGFAEVDEHDEFERVARYLDELDDRSREVLVNHFGLCGRVEMSISAIARSLGLTSRAVSAIQQEALEYLRILIAGRNEDEP